MADLVADNILGWFRDGKVLTPGWDKVAGRHPRGSPVTMAAAPDGAIWVTDDRSRAILRIARPR